MHLLWSGTRVMLVYATWEVHESAELQVFTVVA